jgi:hypothetical protein
MAESLQVNAYFRNLAEARKYSQNNYEKWLSAYNYLESFTKVHCTIGDIAETQREFLTLEELQALAGTECEIPELKRAALFFRP